MKKYLVLALLAALGGASVQATQAQTAAPSHADAHPHWAYKGALDPLHWGDIEADFAGCKLGHNQSPIDIRKAVKTKLPALAFGYTLGPAEVVNTGHSIQVNLAQGGTLKLDTGNYQLLQFHFHTPSEEKIKGKAYPLVAHLVHRDDTGHLSVAAVLFKLGQENPVLAKIFALMPEHEGAKAELPGGLNAADLLPAHQGYYTFMGSLTTPPCSEGVRWEVLKEPVQMSAAQLAQFQKLYPMNARPVQPLHGRKVQQSR